jgi:hypothetical protein
VEIRRITDAQIIRDTISDPHIARMSCPDTITAEQTAEWLIGIPGAEFMGVYIDSVYSGMFITHPFIGGTWAHVCLLPRAYGEKATEAARSAIQLTWDHIQADRVIVQIVEFNRAAVRFAESLGFKELGRIFGGWLCDGWEFDSLIFTLSRSNP